MNICQQCLLMCFHECHYGMLVKPHAGYSVIILIAPLAVFTEQYRLLRVNQAIGVGAGKFLCTRRIFAQMYPKFPEKTPKKMTFQKNDCISFHVGCIFLIHSTSSTIFARFTPNLPKFP